MKRAIALISLLAASAHPYVELRPMRKVTVLPLNSCDVKVTFQLTVSDGNSEDYYCPRVVWEWEDGLLSSEQSDCPPFEDAAPSDHRRTWTRTRAFQGKGTYLIRAHLCRLQRRVATVEATAVITGWEGYPPQRRGEFGCSPPHARPTPIPATPHPSQPVLPDGEPMPGDNDMRLIKPAWARDVCG